MLNNKAKRYIISKIRLAWRYYDDARKECLNGTKCVDCAKKLSKEDKRADHIVPVVPPEDGFTDWNTYINRLFCKRSGLQLLCVECHDRKTKDENDRRK